MLDGLAALTKALVYAAVLTAAGTPLAAASLRITASTREFATRLMRRAAFLVLVFNVVLATLLFIRLGGSFDEPTLGAVFASGAGAAFALQLSGALMLLVPSGDDEANRGWRISGALAITASAAFNGHSAAVGPAAGLIAMVHVTAAAWWTASLWQLRCACDIVGTEDIASLVARFSRLAVRIVGGLIVAGIVLIATLVDFDRSPWFTDYLQLLLVKLVLVACLLLVATYNKFRLTPRLRLEGAGRLRRTIALELALIAGIVVATAVLTTYYAPEE